MPKTYKTIILPGKLHVDIVVALLLLREYGESKFPGISKAKLKFVDSVPGEFKPKDLEATGVIAIDTGGGRFDHHDDETKLAKECSTTLVAKYLGINQDPALKKLIRFALRDDIEGKGIVSGDVLDRAFGFPGLLINLTRYYPDKPQKVIEIALPLLQAHLKEENNRNHVLPAEYLKCSDSGKMDAFVMKQDGKQLRIILIETDAPGMIGFLRAYNEIRANIIAQKSSSGHINIITQQNFQIDLRNIAGLVRLEEARKNKVDLSKIDLKTIAEPRKHEQITKWYYDTVTNSMQNGGARPESVDPTILDLKDIKKIFEIGFDMKNKDLYQKISQADPAAGKIDQFAYGLV